MKEHLARQHECFDELIVQCPVCGIMKPTKKRLNEHLRVHLDAKLFSCKCGREFKQNESLKKHLRTQVCEFGVEFCAAK